MACQEIQFQQVQVGIDAGDNAHIFALSVDNNLYHLSPQPNEHSSPVNIQENVSALRLAHSDGGTSDLFTVGSTDNAVTHLFLHETGTNWQAQTVEVDSEEQIESYISYNTDITVADLDGAPLINSPVTVTAGCALPGNFRCGRVNRLVMETFEGAFVMMAGEAGQDALEVVDLTACSEIHTTRRCVRMMEGEKS